MIDAVVIEGVTFPVAYNGYTYSRNKIWSKNTGRNDYGEMVGTIVDIKDKVELQLPPLTGEQALLLDNVVSDVDNPFPTAQRRRFKFWQAVLFDWRWQYRRYT